MVRMIRRVPLTALKVEKNHLDAVRSSGLFLEVTHSGKFAVTVTPLTVEEFRAIRGVLKAYLATGREDGLVGSAFVKLGVLE